MVAGLVGDEKATRKVPPLAHASVIAPESLGLPADESYNYLALLKR